MATKLMPKLSAISKLADSEHDGVVVVSDCTDKLQETCGCLHKCIEQYRGIDAATDNSVSTIFCAVHKTLIYAATGPVTRDYDDVRRFQDAAGKGISRALAAGCKRPLLVVCAHDRYPLAVRVTLLGALQTLYTPLEVREMCPNKAVKAASMGVMAIGASPSEDIKMAVAIESGRVVYRDIGGSDPERTAPPKVVEYVEENFKGTCIKVKVISDQAVLEKEYPLLAAVNRASRNVPRHHARVIELEYTGDGEIDTTLMLVGKGVTYDTGGADVKAGGHMAGMHRDKCGSAFVAGFFQLLSVWRPKGIKVMGAMCMVRNSIGSECYVADEIIVSRAGVRIRVGNTDAEGRMAMADVLCHMKEKAPLEKNPQIFTVATLTGHVIRCYGDKYTAILENGPARSANIGQKIQDNGELCGDPFERSFLRREDFDFHAGPSEYEDVLQCNNLPSTMTPRGHQSPAAFLILASGLDKHGNDSSQPLPFSHVDIAGSSGPFPGVPTGAPIPAMAHTYVLNRPSAV